MTNILTRTMDLVHTYNEETHTHTFTFDTTYPVKVSGNIIKTFIATADLHRDDIFVVDNGSGMYTTIPFANIYGFRQQLNVEEYFVTGDTVMVIFNLNTSGAPGSCTICNLAPVSDTSNQGLYIKYMCNGINDAAIINNALQTIYNAQFGDEFDVLGCHLTAGYIRDVTIDITGLFGLQNSAMQNINDNERLRYYSYIDISPLNQNPFFSVKLDFSKSVIDCSPVRDDIGNGADTDPQIGISTSGYRAFLFSYGHVESRPKLFVNGLRLDSDILGLFISNMLAPTGDMDILSVDNAYVKFTDIRYVDTQGQNSEEPSEYSLACPTPMLIDNVSGCTTVDISGLNILDIYNPRFHIIANSGTCNIENATVYYGLPEDTTGTFKTHHILNTLDSLIVNCPDTFNTNDHSRYLAIATDAQLLERHPQTDTRNIKTALDHGYIFNNINFNGISTLPVMTISNTEFHVEYHNIISNIGGDIVIKNTKSELTPLSYTYDKCFENSHILSYAGNVVVNGTDFILNSTKGINGIHALPMKTDTNELIVPNVKCDSSTFFFVKDVSTIFQNDVEITTPQPEPRDVYKPTLRSMALAFNILTYMPSNVNGITADGTSVNYEYPYKSVALVTINGCDFSAKYTGENSTYNFMMDLLKFGAPLDVMCGTGIMYARGNALYKVSSCTCGMNGKSDGTSFSNCPIYGFYMFNTYNSGGLNITDSVINVCTHNIVYRPNLNEYDTRIICYNLMKGITTGYTAETADFNGDGNVTTADGAVGLEWLKHRVNPYINIANTTLKNGFAHLADMPDDMNDPGASTKFPWQIPGLYDTQQGGHDELQAKVFPGIYCDKIETSSFSNIKFECGCAIINPVAIDSIISITNCDFECALFSGVKVSSYLYFDNNWTSHIHAHNLDLDDYDANASIRLLSCNFHRHAMTMIMNNQDPMPQSFEQKSKIYDDSDRTKLRVQFPEAMICEPIATINSLGYRGFSASNIPDIHIDSCEFNNDGRAIYIENLHSISYGNTSCNSSDPGVSWDIIWPTSRSISIRNCKITNHNDIPMATGLEANITIFNAGKVDIENNTILSAGAHTTANIECYSDNLKMGDHFNVQSMPMYVKIKNNICCCTKYDSYPSTASGYSPYSKADVLNEINRTDPTTCHVADDLNHLMIYASNIVLLGSEIHFTISDNTLYKTRGTIGVRKNVVTTAKDWQSGSSLLTFTNNQKNALLEEFNTRNALISGRSILMGFGGVENRQSGYRGFRELKLKGKIENNHMGPVSGDALLYIDAHIASAATDGCAGGEFFDTSIDGLIQVHDTPTDPDIDTFWRTVDINCKNNTTEQDPIETYNEMSDGYKFNIVSKRFFK